MNSQRLKDLIKNMPDSVSFEEYYVRFATERFLARLQKTAYLDKFVIKGGFLLETIYDIQQRTTQDLDTLVRNISNEKEELLVILETIAAVDLNDNVTIEVSSIETIQEQKKYAGIRTKMILRFLDANSFYNFTLDIGVGDVITPKPYLREIPLLFNDTKHESKSIKIYSYPVETILAEKTETILTLSTNNSRMKDFYDIYLILSDSGLPSIEACYSAFSNTWTYRSGLPLDAELFEVWLFVIDQIKQDTLIQKKYWPNYVAKRSYAKSLKLEDILLLFERYIKQLQQEYLRQNS
ncbi:nucleotidyl transferase AbiEii/AbiGii toxin family protein [Enterococcus sp. DIV0187]|uniref:nucleotidyl transferase AbiEii/AbiGii toxin family protein n=1 Tax=Enterococcus sp. DIV0187 TaxID=2774644 RepID=UPI003F243409